MPLGKVGGAENTRPQDPAAARRGDRTAPARPERDCRTTTITGTPMPVDQRRSRRVTVLGSFSVREGPAHAGGAAAGDGVPVPLGPDAARLVAYLAVHRRPQRRTAPAAALWPGTPAAAARALLDEAVTAAVAAGLVATGPDTHPAGADGRGVGVLTLAADVAVDLHAALALVRSLTDAAPGGLPADLPEDTVAATALLAADVLPGEPAAWLAVERERFRQLRLNALEELSGRLGAANRHAEAVLPAREAVHAAPSRESARRALIEAHLGQGDIAEAVAQYDAYQELLRSSVGGGLPGPEGAFGLDGLLPPVPAWPVLRVRRPLRTGATPPGVRIGRGPRRLVSGSVPGTVR